MLKLQYAFFALTTAVFLFGCNAEDDQPFVDENILAYDGENVTGPILVAADYEASAQFFGADLSNSIGKNLVEVSWFMGANPSVCLVRIYGEGTSTTPGDLLFEADVTAGVRTPGWNAITLQEPIPITGEGLWLSIAFTHPDTQQSIGCDAGPAQRGGDWLYSSEDMRWRTFSQRTGENINWNIRGRLE